MNESSIQFESSKNGQQTCKLNSVYFHSKYNPQNEARQFVENLLPEFNSKAIIIIEPGISYCIPFLKQKFPNVKLYAIRLFNDFKQWDNLWDEVFYFKENTLSQSLYFSLGEEILLTASVFSWTGSKNAAPELNDKIWKEIKQSVLMARNVLYTREHFSKRWFINSVKFFKNLNNSSIPLKTDKDILITASGPSLKNSLPFIKRNRSSFFLISVSSSLSVLLKNSIIPDIVLSTDGGYWAKKHLELSSPYSDKLKDTLFAFTDESSVPSSLYNKKIIPLFYENSIGQNLFDSFNINCIEAKRNGTVSGTAALFALNLTTSNVYFCGLDLCSSMGFQHTQPNNLEIINSSKDNYLHNIETRQTKSRFNSEGSLEIYRNWFTSQKTSDFTRLYRLSDNFKYSTFLLPIKDINWSEVKFSPSTQTKLKTNDKSVFADSNTLKEKLLNIIESNKWDAELFPLESLLISREKDDDKIIQSKLKLKEAKDKLKEKLGSFL